MSAFFHLLGMADRGKKEKESTGQVYLTSYNNRETDRVVLGEFVPHRYKYHTAYNIILHFMKTLINRTLNNFFQNGLNFVKKMVWQFLFI